MRKFSLLELVKSGGYDASLMTTYAINFPVYEQLLLRKLISGGCRYNVVVADRQQLALSWASRELRPDLAGIAYTLMPIQMGGAFHPKIWFLAGRKKAALVVGSHNLTLAGLGYNKELTTLVELGPEPDIELDGLCRDAWQAVKTWVHQCDQHLPKAVCDAVLRFEEFIVPYLRTPSPQPAVEFHSQGAHQSALLDAVTVGIAEEVRRIAVLGPYFDASFEFLKVLHKRWPSAKLAVGITPEALADDKILELRYARCVDASRLAGQDRSAFVHAKALYLESRRGQHVLAVGSANPSAPAWLRGDSGRNAEAAFVWRGIVAQRNAEAIGLTRLFDLPPLTAQEVEARLGTQSDEPPNEGPSSMIGVASMDHASRAIEIVIGGELEATRFELRSRDDVVLDKGTLTGKGTISLHVPTTVALQKVHSVQLALRNGVVLIAWLHHTSTIDSLGNQSVKDQVKRALASLTNDEGNLAEVLDAVQKVIFEDEPGVVIHAPVGMTSRKKKGESDVQVQPDTLAVAAASISRRKNKVQVLKSGDLAYLIDVLIRRLAVERPPSESTDRLGRTEEEQIGKDDDDLSKPAERTAQPAMPDAELATLIGRKVNRLVIKLAGYLEDTVWEPQRIAPAIARVIAVLALLRELRRIELLPRWRAVGGTLVPRNAKAELFSVAAEFLLSESHSLLSQFETLVGASTEEAGHARSLLTWLAWDIGSEFTRRFTWSLDTEELKRKVEANAVLFELLPQVVSHTEELAAVRESFTLTTPKTLAARQRQHEWLERHVGLGKKWLDLTATPFNSIPIKTSLELGDLAVVTSDKKPRLRVVAEIGDNHIGLSKVSGIVRFQRDHVLGVQT